MEFIVGILIGLSLGGQKKQVTVGDVVKAFERFHGWYWNALSASVEFVWELLTKRRWPQRKN